MKFILSLYPPNLIKLFIRKRRNKRMQKKWLRLQPQIQAQIEADYDINKIKAVMCWNQLIPQEISIWIQIGKPVTRKEFSDMCHRRAFTDGSTQLLKALMSATGLLPWYTPPFKVDHPMPPVKSNAR